MLKVSTLKNDKLAALIEKSFSFVLILTEDKV